MWDLSSRIFIQGSRSFCHPRRLFSGLSLNYWFCNGGNWGSGRPEDLSKTCDQHFWVKDPDSFCNTIFRTIQHAEAYMSLKVSFEELGCQKLPRVSSIVTQVGLIPEAWLFCATLLLVLIRVIEDSNTGQLIVNDCHRWCLIHVCHQNEGNRPDWRRVLGRNRMTLCLRTSALALGTTGFEFRFKNSWLVDFR